MKNFEDVAFEESISDDWSRDLGIREVPLKNRPIIILGFIVFAIVVLLFSRVSYLGGTMGSAYIRRASLNLNKVSTVSAPRGMIYDRAGKVLADNKISYLARLDVKEFLYQSDLQEKTLSTIQNVLAIPPDQVWSMISEKNSDLDAGIEPVVLSEDVPQDQLLALKDANLATIQIEESYKRDYLAGPAFSSILGYVGLVNGADLQANPKLTGEDYVGKAGLEQYYNDQLLGNPGITTQLRNAKGEVLGQGETRPAKIGDSLNLTIDAGFQKYFYDRMMQGLNSLGKTTGVGIAMNPKTGEVLSMISFPSFNNNVFHESGQSAARTDILTSPLRPLFDRAVGGVYTPGSTIKPLVGVAALTEGVVNPQKTVFSPGYLDVPNPYNPDKPTRFLDWRYQGTINLASALAQSSNVYFYAVGGGAFDIKGLGITRLEDWWAKFGLGSLTGIDLPGEAKGFLPSPEWKQSSGRGLWLLGDTYNASIGQGDLQITPIQLLDYISSIANGGKVLTPYLSKDSANKEKVRADLTALLPEIKEVQKGMRMTVTSPMGTAFTLNDLPFAVGAKTGSSQIQNNTAENALFVGYAPYDDPQIAILILVERAKEGSLNAVPIAKDILAWYYENRIKNTVSSK